MATKILYLSRGGLIGGSQRQLYYLVTNLNNGYEPLVACSTDGRFVTQLLDNAIPAHVFPCHPWRKFPEAIHRFADARRLVDFARANDVALVHCSDLWLSGYMNAVAKKLGIPSVLHVRTPITTRDVRKHRCADATKIIAISRRVRRGLLTAGIPRRRVVRIHDSVDLSEFQPRPQKEKDLRNDIAIGIVARITPAKRQLDFLRAGHKLNPSPARDVRFILVGQIHDHDYFRKLQRLVANHGMQEQVVFAGRQENIQQVFNSLDILVSFSGGSVMFEAAACGLPVVSAAFDADNNPAPLKHRRTGPLLRPTSLAELVSTLRDLIDNPSFRNHNASKAQAWARETFSHLVMVARTENLYRKLLR
jgi:glycosyltransferase involved in cell wall biosynthesis